MRLVLTLNGRIPSKKNSRISTRSGRTFPSKKYTEWHKDAISQVEASKLKPIRAHTPIVFILYAPDKRKADLSNKWESVADMLVDCSRFVDDNWFVLDDIHMKFGGVDRDNPRGELYIDK